MWEIVVPLVAALGVVVVQLVGLWLSYLRSVKTQDSIGEVKHLVNSHTEKLERRIQQLEAHIVDAGGPVPIQPRRPELPGAGEPQAGAGER